MTQFTGRRIAAAALLTAAISLAGCEGAEMEINGQKGVPLADVVLTGTPPSEVVLASGDDFTIKVEGGNTESLRFVRDERTIGITREEGWSGETNAIIRITMPAPEEVVIAGAGTIKAPTLASEAEVTIGGSGLVEFGTVAAQNLGINIGGSGTIRGAGTVKSLTINIGGSGEVELAGLKADTAEVSIGGAGDVAFASDGEVTANIAGAGDVTVTGKAKCTVNEFGSGTLTCTEGPGASAPQPPTAPEAPTAPVAAKPAE